MALCSAYIGSILYFEYRLSGWFGVGGIAVMYALAFSVRRLLKRSGNTITLSLSSAPSASLRDALLRERRVLALLVSRGAVEAVRRAEADSYAHHGQGRAAQLRMLREEGLWEDLAPPVRDLFGAPEGGWSEEQTGHVLLLTEGVKVLSWMVREDFELPSLRASLEPAPAALRSMMEDTKVSAGGPAFLRSVAQIEAQQEPAEVYAVRIHHELIKRKVSEGELDEQMEQRAGAYMTYAAAVGDADVMAEDLPVGGALVSEVDTEGLKRVRGYSAVRVLFFWALQESISAGILKHFGKKSSN